MLPSNPEWAVSILAAVAQRQAEQFHQCLIARKRVSVLGDFAQAHVHRFNHIGRVDDFTYLRRVVEERDDSRPIPAPGLANGQVGIVLFVFELAEHLLRFVGSSAGVNPPVVSGYRLAHFP